MTPKPLLLLCFLCLFWGLSAQTDPDTDFDACGTEFPPEVIAFMDSLQTTFKYNSVDEFTAEMADKSMVQIPVQLHIIRQTNGTGGITEAQFNNALNYVNTLYQPSNLQFFQCSTPNIIPNSSYFDLSPAEAELIYDEEAVPNVINIFVPNTIFGGQVAGFSFLPYPGQFGYGTDDIVVIAAGRIGTSTFPHELGHYFGLYHTHGKANCIGTTDELADGSNCTTAGDNVCDTPADPTLGACVNRVNNNCQYIGAVTDANGQPYNPSVSNLMSYAPSACRTTFTAGQMMRVNNVYNNYRNYLSCSTGGGGGGGGGTSGTGENCTQARLITGTGTYTTDGPSSGFGATPNTAAQHADWWYFIPPADGTITIESCGSGVDTRLWVRSGACGNLQYEIDADDECPLFESGGENWATRVANLDVNGGTRYYFEWTNQYTSAGFDFDFIYTTSCVPPSLSDMAVTSIGNSHVTVDWTGLDAADAYKVRIRPDFNPQWVESNTFFPNSSHTFVNLLPGVNYEIQVRSQCQGAQSPDWSESFFVETPGGNDTYCPSFGDPNLNWIAGVQLESITVAPDNETDDGNGHGYTNFTNVMTDVSQGVTYPLTLTPGTLTGNTNLFWRIWIDINQDNDFGDPDELVFEQQSGNQTPLSGMLTIPVTALEGETRMRVSMSEAGFPDPCDFSNLGSPVQTHLDVEDYTLNIVFTENLAADPAALDLPATAGSTPLNIDANVDWTLTENLAWIDLDVNSGSTSQEVTVSYLENTSVTPRSGQIVLSGGTQPNDTIAVTQAGAEPVLSVFNNLLNVGPAQGQTTFELDANIDWQTTESSDWLSLDPTAGSGDATLTVSFDENTSTASRSAQITITGGALSETIEVVQAGASAQLSLDTEAQTVGNGAGSLEVDLTANIDWTASSDAAWATVSPASGNGSSTLSIDYEANPVTTDRTATITVTGGGLSDTFVLTQEGETLVLEFSITTQTVGAGAGSTQVGLTANVDWTSSSTAGWATVNPIAGSGDGLLTIDYEANPDITDRIATIKVTGGGLTDSFVLTQLGQAVFISVDPGSADVTAAAGCVDFALNGNANWTASADATWVSSITPASGNGAGTVTVCYDANDTTPPRSATLTFSSAGASATATLNQAGATSPNAPPWAVTATGSNHTIIIPQDLESNINGQYLTEQDWIGFFYDDNGEIKCGGYGQWRSDSNQSMAVYGDDALTPDEKEGFNVGEKFQIRVWSAADQTEYEGEAVFTEPGLIVTHTDTFAIDGISQIEQLVNNGVATQTINLAEGWNLISSYVQPNPADMIGIFSPIIDEVIQIKDDQGNSTIPEFNINDIGNWEVVEGYKVKMASAASLEVSGLRANPGTTPIPIAEGWQYVAYLRDSPGSVVAEMAGIASDLIIVKNNAGGAFIPALSIDNIGDMLPSQGYQLKASAATTLVYSPNTIPGGTPAATPSVLNGFGEMFFDLQGLNTGNNATLVIPLTTVADLLTTGDEIGIFSESGLLVGAAEFEGENLAIAIWGDDATTDIVDGLTTGEPFLLKVWDHVTQEVTTLLPNIADQEAAYYVDALYVLDGFTTTTSVNPYPGVQDLAMYCYPNPVRETLMVETYLPETRPLELTVLDAHGKVMLTRQITDAVAGRQSFSLDLQRLPAGLYALRLRTGEAQQSQRFLKY